MLLNEALKKIETVKKRKEKSLVLSEYKLDRMPSEIEDLFWLESLFISFNSIEDIYFLKKLPKLLQLDLRGNKVSSIEAISALKELEYLDLDNNYIIDIQEIQHLKRLKTVYLSNNKIKLIPDISQLQNLSNLDLCNNKIEDVSSINNISKLISLILKGNNIKDIIGLETNIYLEYLNIAKNQINNISHLKNLPKLKSLVLGTNEINDLSPISDNLRSGLSISDGAEQFDKPANNPLTIPPPEIVAQGTKSIIRYFDEIEKQGSDKLYESKMLVIGEGGAGKTSLVRKIKDRNCILPNEDETTFGIDIVRFPILKMQGGKKFYLNIWDFGGQEIYHSTHQFFLTHRSLYVLIDDTRKDDKSVHDSIFSYWLQIVELLGGNSPLIIVQNEKGDRSKAIDLKSMQARFSFIKDCKQTNLLSNRGLEDVIESIKYWSKQLPHIGETLPKQWIKIRRHIEGLSIKENHITIQEYLKICLYYKIPEEPRALNLSRYLHDLGVFLHYLSRYLHDLGVFLHYQDSKILKNIIILNDTWATDAVYNILDNEEVKKKQGFFTKNDLNRIWSSNHYKYYHHVLIALMEKFELCYKIPTDIKKDTWLAPQLLPIISPDYEWDFVSFLNFMVDQ